MNHSIIIPANNDQQDLTKLLEVIFHNIEKQDDFEIIVIDSSQINSQITIEKSFPKPFIDKLRYFYSPESLFPGAARNLGIQHATGKYISFLDTKTIPNAEWFELLSIAISENKVGFYGKTIYEPSSFTQKIILASTYGFHQLITLPGTIIRMDHLNKIGVFIPSVRAGEDSDWILRSRELDAKLINQDEAHTSYSGVKDFSLLYVLKKWFTNYKSAKQYSHIKDHRFIYILSSFIFLIYFAFNWNNVFARWDESSFFYLANVTKIITFLSVIIYLMYRSLILPRLKGTSYGFIFFGGFLPIFIVSICIDLVKIAAFISPNNK